jgi:hypothetical protein
MEDVKWVPGSMPRENARYSDSGFRRASFGKSSDDPAIPLLAQGTYERVALWFHEAG